MARLLTNAQRGMRAIAQLPKTIRVGHCDFDVIVSTTEHANAHAFYGKTSARENTFWFAPDPGSAMNAVDTVLHEIGHAIFWAYGIKESDDEERVVSIAFGTGLSQVFRDNPWLTGWLAEHTR